MRCVFAFLFLFPCVSSVQADLEAYIRKPEPVFTWKLVKKSDSGEVFDLRLTSQTWQGIVWQHEVQVFVPTGLKPNGSMLLWNTGGKPSLTSSALGLRLANLSKVPVAFLYGIPNQPLFDGKKEDALIAETFVRFLASKDETWPLLFPMAKSLIKAMDALQTFGKEELKTEIRSFIVSGASKRGWTSWLTAAVDPRVKAFAPLVIDTLNMVEQLPHQQASYGEFSKMIADYTERGLVPLPKTPEATKLWQMVDPYSYREKLTQPKLIINGTNDPYWTQDALNLYWDGLQGDKWVLYVPNAGHNLQQKLDDGKTDFTRAVNTLAAFTRLYGNGGSFPKLAWQHKTDGDKAALSLSTDPAPRTARMWSADAATSDFRAAKWTSSPVTIDGGNVRCTIAKPLTGKRVFFLECEFELDGMPYYLSTQLRILAP